jgi:putative ABC transport system substrate-binding protein
MTIGRRQLISICASGVLLASLPGLAQQPAKLPVIGFLNGQAPTQYGTFVAAFRSGLAEMGYVEGRNVAIEYRWAENHMERVPGLASELVARKVAVLTTSGGSYVASSLVPQTIPVLSIFGGDPVKLNLVSSLNRPGGHLSGVTISLAEMEAKRLEMLHHVVGRAGAIAVLANPDGPNAASEAERRIQAAASLHREIRVTNARNERELEPAFTAIGAQRPVGLLVSGDPFFNSQRTRIVRLATRLGVAAIYEWPEFVEEGGLMSYSASLTEAYRNLGIYAGRILKGDKVDELPIAQPTKYELAINLKTARALRIKIPQPLLLRADKVIE